MLQRLKSQLKRRFLLRTLLHQTLDKVPLQQSSRALVAFAILHDFQVRKSQRPWQKWLVEIVIFDFSAQGDTGFLEDIAGIFFMRMHREDETK